MNPRDARDIGAEVVRAAAESYDLALTDPQAADACVVRISDLVEEASSMGAASVEEVFGPLLGHALPAVRFRVAVAVRRVMPERAIDALKSVADDPSAVGDHAWLALKVLEREIPGVKSGRRDCPGDSTGRALGG